MLHKHGFAYNLLLETGKFILPEYWLVARKFRGKTPVSGQRDGCEPVMQMQRMTLNAHDLRFAESEIKDGRETLLMLSALPQSILMYNSIWQRLAEKYNLVAVDLPGSGHSQRVDGELTFEGYGQFLRDFMETRQLSGVHIVGPDIGMAAALGNTVLFPSDRVKSLLIGDGPSVSDTVTGFIITCLVRSGLMRFLMSATPVFILDMVDKVCYMNYRPTVAEIEDFRSAYSGRKLFHYYQWFKNYPESIASIEPGLDSLDLPVQIFWGEHDALLPPASADKLNAVLPRSQVNIIRHAGHFSYQDNFEEFAEMVERWIDGGYASV